MKKSLREIIERAEGLRNFREKIFCRNCENEAVLKLTFVDTPIHLCATCASAFLMGQMAALSDIGNK